MQVRLKYTDQTVTVCADHYLSPPAHLPVLGLVQDARGQRCTPECEGYPVSSESSTGEQSEALKEEVE